MKTGPSPQWLKAGAFSVIVHGGLVATGLGLAGLTEPAQPDPVISVELVFTATPAVTTVSTAPPVIAAPPKPVVKAEPKPAVRPPVKAAMAVSPPVATQAESAPPTPVPTKAVTAEKPIPKEIELNAEPVDIVHAEPPPAKPVDAPPPRRKPKHALDPKPVTRIADIPITKPKKAPPPERATQQASFNPRANPAPAPVEIDDKAKSLAALTPSSGFAAKKAVMPAAGQGNRPPRYPYLARKRGWEGRVVLLVRVAINGKALSIRIKNGSGYSVLDRAARKAVASWKFKPGKLAGIPVISTLEVPVTFRLK